MSGNRLLLLLCVFLLLLGIAAPVGARGGGFPGPEPQGHIVPLDDELKSQLTKTAKMPKSDDQNVKSILPAVSEIGIVAHVQ